MKFYMAPLEGITGYIYRNALHEMFGGGTDKYFTPFIEPHLQKKVLSGRSEKDILPENNAGMYVVPQVLTSSAEAFLCLEKELRARGYREINLNLGCPSQTVVTKGRGAALLKQENLEKLDRLLWDIFSASGCEISVKTRVGYADTEAWPQILEIFEKYPLKELIIHARVREDFYENPPRLDAFLYAAVNSGHSLVYNGDIRTKKDLDMLNAYLSGQRSGADEEKSLLPDAIMTGRGMLMDPKLIMRLSGAADCGASAGISSRELKCFMEKIFEGYSREFSGQDPVLHKMKELWTWQTKEIKDGKRLLKKIVKAKNFDEYMAAAESVYASLP